jgi:hypothetical protein
MDNSLQVVRERDAAHMLGVSVAALRRWRREGRGPAFVRIERCIGYRIATLESFLNSNTVTPQTGEPEKEGTNGPLPRAGR